MRGLGSSTVVSSLGRFFVYQEAEGDSPGGVEGRISRGRVSVWCCCWGIGDSWCCLPEGNFGSCWLFLDCTGAQMESLEMEA